MLFSYRHGELLDWLSFSLLTGWHCHLLAPRLLGYRPCLPKLQYEVLRTECVLSLLWHLKNGGQAITQQISSLWAHRHWSSFSLHSSLHLQCLESIPVEPLINVRPSQNDPFHTKKLWFPTLPGEINHWNGVPLRSIFLYKSILRF